MKISRVLVSSLVVTVFSFISSTSARAAEEGAGWYTKADVGISFVQDVKVHTTDLFGTVADQKFTFDPGVRVDLGIGYEFNKSWAIEFNPAFIYNNAKITTETTAPFTATSTTSDGYYQLPVMINGIYTLPLDGRFKPYIGLGVGLELSGVSDLGGDIVGVGQVIVGMKYELNDQMDIGICYKLLATTEHDWEILSETVGEGSWTHSIMATFTYRF